MHQIYVRISQNQRQHNGWSALHCACAAGDAQPGFPRDVLGEPPAGGPPNLSFLAPEAPP